MIGKTLGQFRVIEKLGAGGMGEVYKAEDTRLHRSVALKFLSAEMANSRPARDRFEREARTIAGLNHAHICAIYDLGEHQGGIYIVMELLEGQSLRDRLKSGPIPMPELLHCGLQIAEGLEAAHARGIVHRDLKPANLFITPKQQVKILDFGLAKSSGPKLEAYGPDAETAASSMLALTGPGMVLGTPGYMSPEQARGEAVDARSDLFSLSVVLYEAATGQPAFTGTSVGDVLAAIMRDEPRPMRGVNSRIPEKFADLVAKAMDKNRGLRHQSASELRIDLLRLQRELESSQLPAAAVTSQPGTTTVRATRSSQQMDSLLILPFENTDHDPAQAYLCEGVAETLIYQLAMLPKLKVVARCLAFRHQSRLHEAELVARELGTRAVLTGRVRRHGAKLRIAADLMDTATGNQLWGAQYDRDTADLLAVQEEIANQIAGALRGQLSRGQRKKLTRAPARNSEAFRLCLQAAYHTNQWTAAELRQSVSLLRRALALDPDYARAHAMLALVFAHLYVFNYAAQRDEAEAAIRHSVRRALELDPHSSLTCCASSMMKFWLDWDWEGGQADLRRAVDLDPELPDAYHSDAFIYSGQYEEAQTRLEKMVELDPVRAPVFFWLANNEYHSHRDSDAIAHAQKCLELEPDFIQARILLTRAFRQLGQIENAKREWELIIQRGAPALYIELAKAGLALAAGDSAAARKHLVLADDQSEPLLVLNCAAVWIQLEEPGRAVEALANLVRRHEPVALCIHGRREFAVLHSRADFQELLRAIHPEPLTMSK